MGSVLLLGSDSLSVEDVADFARRPDRWEIRLDEAAEERMAASVRARDDLVASGRPVYGVTTGFGDSCTRHIGPGKAADLQHNLIAGHLAGNGAPAPAEVARATVLIRANCLARGYSGVRAALVELLADCLRADILPVIPQRGSVSMATIAARDAWHTVELVRHIAAITLAALCQAVDLRGSDRPAPATREAYELVRTVVGFVERDRRLDTESADLAELIGSGGFGALLGAASDQPTEELPAGAERPGVGGHA